jgi:glyoxylase-like metal-dependent hydrolase (beta-lactamase superfamily II)
MTRIDTSSHPLAALLAAGLLAIGCGQQVTPMHAAPAPVAPAQVRDTHEAAKPHDHGKHGCKSEELFAKVPAGALGLEIPAKGYLLVPVRDGLYVMTNGIYQLMFLVSDQGVIVVDAPPSLAWALPQAVAEVTSQPITHLVYSHAHVDHTAGAGLLPASIQRVAHEETATLLRKAQDPNRPVPTVTFSGETTYVLEVGNQRLELGYKGINHQIGELFIYAPRQKTLMHVDMVFPGWAPFKALAIAQDIPGLMRAMDQTLEYDFDTFVGGHLGRPGTRQDVEQTRAYLLDLKTAAIAANAAIDYATVTRDVDPQNVWAQFKRYSDAVTDTCVERMPKKWLKVLGGADVFLRDNCFTMTESLRID